MLGSKKKKWQKQEKEVAETMKGRRTKASGAGYQKGDVRTEDLLIECKTTKFKSFSVTQRLLEKLDKDSFGSDKIPIIAVELEDGARKFYVLPDYAFERLLNA